MLYLGVQVEVETEEAGEKVASLPFFSLTRRKDNIILGVIEIKDLAEWRSIEAAIGSIPGVVSVTILSAVSGEEPKDANFQA
jgi:hypothetical protein